MIPWPFLFCQKPIVRAPVSGGMRQTLTVCDAEPVAGRVVELLRSAGRDAEAGAAGHQACPAVADGVSHVRGDGFPVVRVVDRDLARGYPRAIRKARLAGDDRVCERRAPVQELDERLVGALR